MTNWLAIFIGGGLGSLARYGMHRWLGMTSQGFPLGTLAANLLACVVLGFLGGLLMARVDVPEYLRTGAMVGFCGGFSTFSTFSNEGVSMFGNQRPGFALLYIGVSVLICFIGIWLGQWLGKSLG